MSLSQWARLDLISAKAWQQWIRRTMGKDMAEDEATARPWIENYPIGVPAKLHYPSMSVGQAVDQAADRFPNNPAIRFDRARFTYAELKADVDRFAAALHQLDVHKGDRVLIALPNCPEYVITFFAALKLGAVVVQAGPLLGEDELLYLGQKTSPQVVVTLDLLGGRMEKLGDCPFVQQLIFVSLRQHLSPAKQVGYWFKERSGGYTPGDGSKRKVHEYAELMAKAPAYPPSAGILPEEDLAVLQPTGGTTGKLKAAKLTHQNLLANATQIRVWSGLQEGQETVLGVLPLFHSYAMTTCLVAPVLGAANVVLQPRFIPEDVLDVIRQEKPTVFPMVPGIAVALNKLVAESKSFEPVPPIRLCISGAAKLHKQVKLEFESWSGGRLIEGYGLSEASPVTHANPADGRDRTGSIGLPLPDTEARIVDPKDGQQDMPVNEVGELIIRGPQIMQGYLAEVEQTAIALRDGWLCTGDLARMDEDGYFYVVDRKKDLIITNGFNVYPVRVEEALYNHPAVQDVAVIGRPDEERGEIVVARVVKRDGQDVAAE